MGISYSQITSWLYVGDAESCTKTDAKAIIHVFRSDVSPSQERDCKRCGCDLRMDWKDGEALDFSNLRNLDAFIEKIREKRCKVLVHCYAGMCRSPTVAIYLLVKLEGMTPHDARSLVTERIYQRQDAKVCNIEYKPYKQIVNLWEQQRASKLFRDGELKAIMALNGWCSEQKAIRIAELLAGLPEKSFGLEIGVFAGRSLFAAAAGMRASGGFVQGVDAYDAEENLRGVDTPEHRRHWPQSVVDWAKDQMCQTMKRLGFGKWCGVVVCNSRDYLNDKELAYLHIDGNHSGEGAKSDAEMFLPWVKPGGLVLVDDTHPTKDFDGGVGEAVKVVEASCTLTEDYGTWRVYKRN